jgi:stress response protein YsnF
MDEKIGTVAIPVVEEELQIGRREVETGRVRVRTVTEERTETASDRLLHSDVEVERVAVNRAIDELPTIREEGDVMIVPVIEERLVKRLFLVEEVHIRRRVTAEQFEHPVKLRSQRVVVDRQQSGGEAINQGVE